ncbi:hypothetical protein Cni_G26967 [Canna indica]|uniref:Uncharacterized protein n=1 Tax=Canna indica TaxID=4628 RepID=A0AAQ3L0W4_9LILI|nr:hypothetical protein Cni_G26967 [Canna indica]
MPIQNLGNSPSPLNVNEEYKKSLRTKSFLDMWSKVHDQKLRPTISSEETIAESSSSSSPLSYGQLPHFLLEPSQESVVAATTDINDHLRVHSLLLEYFDITFQAFAACANLLTSISRARLHHRLIRHLLLELSSAACFHDAHNCTTFDHLASLVDDVANPLHPQKLAPFYRVQSDYGILVKRLTGARRRILRRARLVRVATKAARVAAIGACSVAVALAVVVAVHTVVGIGVAAAAAPMVMTTGPRAAMRSTRPPAKVMVAAQVDAAARGAYIVGRDFDTMSRMLRRAHDEVEHERDVARMVVRGRERQLVREAAREMETGAKGVADQLEELEEHVHLCLITINRSRKMVAAQLQEMMVSGSATSPAVA